MLISVAALEAYANELFIDHEKIFPELPIEVMAKLWEFLEQKPILGKFEFALVVKRGQTFDHGTAPYLNVATLIRLRNGLVHFKPEWFDEQREHAKLSKRLAARKIKNSPFLTSEPLFPRAWAGSSCTTWAVRSVANFFVEFERRVGIERLTKFANKTL